MRQRIKLTGTNRSCGLVTNLTFINKTLSCAYIKTIVGGDSEEDTPVPISNTEVKLFSADGTAWEAEWESRTLPNFLYIPGISLRFRVFIF